MVPSVGGRASSCGVRWSEVASISEDAPESDGSPVMAPMRFTSTSALVDMAARVLQRGCYWWQELWLPQDWADSGNGGLFVVLGPRRPLPRARAPSRGMCRGIGAPFPGGLG